ncbi:MAG: helix-turn-helix domain-containing protein [Bdellovibrionaceae bacterium]|nr:helix-turn-helix domain-containing protein [Pseudobdellovibrionaceae bacterium]
MAIRKRVKEILKNGEFVPAKTRVAMTPGQTLRMMRELQELSQNELAELSGLPQSTISGMESGRINIGVERAKVLARALRVHPAVILFPGWEVGHAS